MGLMGLDREALRVDNIFPRYFILLATVTNCTCFSSYKTSKKKHSGVSSMDIVGEREARQAWPRAIGMSV